MKKKILILTLILTLLTTQISTLFAWESPLIFERVSEPVIIGEGATHQTIQRFLPSGWVNINVTRAKLSDTLYLDVLTHDSLANRSSLNQLVQHHNDEGQIAAAINADFFDIDRRTTMGHVVRQGEVLTTGIGFDGPHEFASFNVTTTGFPHVGYFNAHNNLFTNGVSTHRIDYYNKPYLYGDVTILYNNAWTDRSYGNMSQTAAIVHEILVVDGIVEGIRVNQAPFDIPENGYVIASTGAKHQEIEGLFKVGDQVNLLVDPDFARNQLMVGGGAQIVKEGKPLSEFSLPINGRHPRTAVGISQDRTEVIFVTVDGRSQGFRGVTLKELADIMVSLGAYEAINMDGGGSTQMMVDLPFENSPQTVNHPSDGTSRSMYTGLAMKRKTVDEFNPIAMSLNAEQSDLFIHSPKAFDIEIYNSNMKHIAGSEHQVKWSHEGIEGTWSGNTFTPSQGGQGKIIAEFKSLKAELNVIIHDHAVALNVSPSSMHILPGERSRLSFSVLTDRGFNVPISPLVIKPHIDTTAVDFDPKSGILTGVHSSSPTTMSFSLDEMTAHAALYTTSSTMNLLTFEEETARFSSYPLDVRGNYSEVPSEHGYAGMLTYDFNEHTTTRAVYANLITPLVLPTSTTRLNLSVKGDEGGGHWLRARIIDATGKSANLTLAQSVEWEGWKTVQATLPENLVEPITLQSIYLVQPNVELKGKGFIQFDNLSATVTPSPVLLPTPETRIQPLEDRVINPKSDRIVELSYAKGEQLPSSAISSSETFLIQELPDLTLIHVDNSRGSIRLANENQWPKLMHFFNRNINQPLVLMMQQENRYVDSLEKQLLYEQLNELGVDVTIVYPTRGKQASEHFKAGVREIYLPYNVEDKTFTLLSQANGPSLEFELREYILRESSVMELKDVYDHWSKDAVLWAITEEIVNGYPDGSFRPEQEITESELMAIVAKYVHQTDKDRLKEIEGTHWSQVYYNVLNEWGLPMAGLNDDSQKQLPVTRGSFAQLIASVYGFNLNEKQAVYFLYENEFSQGMTPGEFTFESYGPSYPLNRAQVVTFFKNITSRDEKVTFRGQASLNGQGSPRDIIGIIGIEPMPHLDVDFKDFKK